MKKLVVIVLCILTFALVSCGPNRKNEITDGFKDEYKLVLPFDNLDVNKAGSLYFKTTPLLSFDDMRVQLEKNNYYVEKSSLLKNEHLLVGFKDKDSYKLCFIIERVPEDDSRYVVNQLIQGLTDNMSPFPIYLASQLESSEIDGTDTVFKDYDYYAETSATFDEYLYFYNHSITEVVTSSSENKSIVVKSVSGNDKDNNKLTTRITVFEHNGKTYVGTKGLSS